MLAYFPFRITSLKKESIGAPSSPASDHNGEDALDAHALHLRKVSEQLLSNPRTRQSVTGIPVLNSRPGSFASPKGGGGGSGVASPAQRLVASPHSAAAAATSVVVPLPQPPPVPSSPMSQQTLRNSSSPALPSVSILYFLIPDMTNTKTQRLLTSIWYL